MDCSSLLSVEQELKDIHLTINDLFLIPVNYTNVLYVHAPFCLKRCSFCTYFYLMKSIVNIQEIRNCYEHFWQAGWDSILKL